MVPPQLGLSLGKNNNTIGNETNVEFTKVLECIKDTFWSQNLYINFNLPLFKCSKILQNFAKKGFITLVDILL